jgi:anhydro-N-acetylmuramic acid kinase
MAKHNIKAETIRGIGSHGQTLRHRPDLSPPFTLQIGDPHIIAERTKITVVADVRRRDMAAGGQGAPLAPGFHESIFRHDTENRIILNIGGISNISIIPSNLGRSQTLLGPPLLGFDTGPGNGLMDAWISKNKNLPFDNEGEFGASGKVSEALLNHMLSDPYFALPHPKSTGREYFNITWLENVISKYKSSNSISELQAADIQATLVELTARSIAIAIKPYTNDKTAIYACGGGVKNPVLMNALSKHTQLSIQTTAVLGVPSEWVETMLFAWIAKQTLESKPSNCPSVTGARHPVPLGGIFMAAHI